MASAEPDDSFKDRGNKAYQTGDYTTAVDLYTEGIEHEPSNAVLFSNRSAAFLNLGFYDKSKRDAEMCIQLDQKWSKGWWRKGMAQIENQEYKAARSTFNEGLFHCPGDSNLIAGIEKANKYIVAVESVQGEQIESEYDIDGPAQRKRPADEASTKNNDNVDDKSTTEKGVFGEDDDDDNASNINTQNTSSNTGNASNNTAQQQSDEKATDQPWPGTAAEEIERIKHAPNHYAVLHVPGDANAEEMKKNYYKLAKLLHPDRCQLEGAGEAMTSVSQAYDTLQHVLKRTLYDQFLQQTGGEEDAPNQTYQEWESKQQPVEIPKWLSFILGIRGCGFILLIIFCIILLPVIIFIVILYVLFTCLCLPVSCFFRIFFPEKYKRMKEREERELRKMEEEAQDRMYPHV